MDWKRLAVPPFQPDYLSIVDGFTLQPLNDINSSTYAVACVAVWADGVRLIDNIILKKIKSILNNTRLPTSDFSYVIARVCTISSNITDTQYLSVCC